MKNNSIQITTEGTPVRIIEEILEGKEYLVEAMSKRHGCFVTQVKKSDLKSENFKK